VQIFEGRLRFGIQAGQQNTDFPNYLATWRKAEDLGLDGASCFDHFLPIFSDPESWCFEAYTTLAAMAASTSRLRCGIVVTGVTYRHPAVVANMAATIDHISGGRLELGKRAAWFQLEHEQYGIPFPPFRIRAEMLREACLILRSMWTNKRTTFEGRHYRLKDALCEPKPVQSPSIPLWVGVKGCSYRSSTCRAQKPRIGRATRSFFGFARPARPPSPRWGIQTVHRGETPVS
jgi:alkanesulfonate monooxygenase SsuD/methylene tetrahydromethanopterin reductase-like flavin-dependent oxidoreductase (luciferase family)